MQNDSIGKTSDVIIIAISNEIFHLSFNEKNHKKTQIPLY
jgi:hypothetical protein